VRRNDVVVINHHLFFTDLAVRESGVAELLPSGSVSAIFDRAHQLNERAVFWVKSDDRPTA
jgi:ATP-dependent DNA helicase DinG